MLIGFHHGNLIKKENTVERYELKVKAIDEHGAESDWATLEVSMP